MMSFFKAEDNCTWTARDLYDAPRCEIDPCAITQLEVLNATCTDPDPTYDLQLKIYHQNALNSGTLDVEIGGITYKLPYRKQSTDSQYLWSASYWCPSNCRSKILRR